MIFLETSARTWLILHGVVGAALVASSTHLVVWTRGLWAGKAGRWRGVRWFAAITLALYVAAFAMGNLLYPVYKVRVRVEYLDAPAAIRAEAEARAAAHALVESRRTGVDVPPARFDAPQLGGVARAFDVKEHWAALGMVLAFAAFALAWRWDPRRDGAEVATASGSHVAGKALFCFAVGTAACAWLGAIMGLYVSSFRSIGLFT